MGSNGFSKFQWVLISSIGFLVREVEAKRVPTHCNKTLSIQFSWSYGCQGARAREHVTCYSKACACVGLDSDWWQKRHASCACRISWYHSARGVRCGAFVSVSWPCFHTLSFSCGGYAGGGSGSTDAHISFGRWNPHTLVWHPSTYVIKSQHM